MEERLRQYFSMLEGKIRQVRRQLPPCDFPENWARLGDKEKRMLHRDPRSITLETWEAARDELLKLFPELHQTKS